MKLERNSIAPYEFTFSIVCFMHGTVLRSGYIISITRQESWIMGITGFLLSLLILLIYSLLIKRFPSKNLMEINEAVFGTVGGKIISALYFFFFISLAALNTRDAGNFVTGYMMPETPIRAIALMFLFACMYAIKKRLSNLFHLSTLIVIVVLVAMILNTVLIFKDINFDFLSPLFQLEPQKYIQGTVSLAAVPLGEVLIFMMLTPMVNNHKKASRALFFGIVISTISMILVMLRDIVTLGPLVSVVSLPTLESIRYVSLDDIISRLESIYATLLIILLIFKVTVLLYVSVLSFSQITGSTPTYDATSLSELCHDKPIKTPVLPILAALTFFYSIFVFESVMENIQWGATAAPFFSLTFELLLPAVTLLTAVLRKKKIRFKEVTA